MKKATALYFLKPKVITYREEVLPPLKKDHVQICTKFSAISAGTEMLMYRGDFPDDLLTDVSISALAGQLKYPMKYGYSLVGQITDVAKNVDRKLVGKWAFVFHPHQTELVVNLSDLFLIPPSITPLEALFFPNLETAISVVMDARPVLGERIVIFGQGVVGLLTTALLAKIPHSMLIAIDPIKKRLKMAKKFGADHVLSPLDKNYHRSLQQLLGVRLASHNESAGADLVVELSGNPDTLNSALELAGYQARIIVGSWYGNKIAFLNLGKHFHRHRLQITGSQVSTISPYLRGRWNKQRRFDFTWHMLTKIKPSSLISHRIPFSMAENAYQLIDQQPDSILQVVLTY